MWASLLPALASMVGKSGGQGAEAQGVQTSLKTGPVTGGTIIGSESGISNLTMMVVGVVGAIALIAVFRRKKG